MSHFARLEGGPFDGDNAEIPQVPDLLWVNYCPHRRHCHPSGIDWHIITAADEPLARDMGYQPYHRDRHDAGAIVYVWANITIGDQLDALHEATA